MLSSVVWVINERMLKVDKTDRTLEFLRICWHRYKTSTEKRLSSAKKYALTSVKSIRDVVHVAERNLKIARLNSSFCRKTVL